MKKLIIIISVLLYQLGTNAQETWTINSCIDYAIDNNIELNTAYNIVAQQEVNVLESKANILPSLNIGTNASFNFGRSIDGNNAVTFEQTFSNNYWIESSISIFQGLVKYNNMAFNRYVLAANEQNAEKQRNQLIINILSSYYTVLYSKGLADVAHKQVDLSYVQFNRMQKLVDVGKESPITVQNLKSQWAKDKLSLTQAKNNENANLLNLKQLLRIDAHKTFVLDTLNLNSLVVNPTPHIDSVFSEAVAILPEVKQQEYLLVASEKDLAMAKGGISPRISMAAGFGTGYYDENPATFNNQLTNNQNKYVAMGLNIPVFNGASTYSRIKRKQINVINMQLLLEKQKDNLYTEIWTAINDLESAKNEYEASVELHGYSKLDFENITKKLEKGLASATDYEAAKQRFVSAEATLLKAKLIYMLRNQMLEFYKTGSWGHL